MSHFFAHRQSGRKVFCPSGRGAAASRHTGFDPIRRSVAIALPLAPLWMGISAGQVRAAAPTAQRLAPVLDTLVPADETPSASALGIHRRLIDLAGGIENYPRLLAEGLDWLDQTAGHGFGSLPPEGRDRVIEAAFAAAAGTLPQVFATRVRADTMTLYYRDPRSWPGTGLTEPIQPAGYPDHALPPSPE
uniref:Gluconate 2-dehydrogenase subunit 3 family protein n=1 Tax=Cereibacter sphaeroides (strain ATCC 17025 / ATH 2.4.3) TaxID=349102 RepID=A4WZS4_CERS5